MTWDHLVLPIGSPVRVEPGDTVRALIRADSTGRDTTMSWSFRVNDASGGVKGESSHSTFFGLLLTKDHLAMRPTDAARTVVN
jgi:hypothetical protein